MELGVEHEPRGDSHAVHIEQRARGAGCNRTLRVHGVLLFYRTERRGASRSGLRYAIGKFYDGYKRSYAWGPTFRPNEKLNASLNVQLNDISLPTVSYLSTLTTTRVNYNFNTKVFVNALLQYSTDSHQLSSNIRFNVIHRPLSDFFFVYNEHRDEHTGLLQDRSLIAKMTYMVAF